MSSFRLLLYPALVLVETVSIVAAVVFAIRGDYAGGCFFILLAGYLAYLGESERKHMAKYIAKMSDEE